MIRKSLIVLLSLVFTIGCLNGCQTTGPKTSPGIQAAIAKKSFEDYPDQAFNVKEYIRGMTKSGRNILSAQDPSAELKKYNSVIVSNFTDRLLPPQNHYSYTPFTKTFNKTFSDMLKLKKGEENSSLRITGALVECNPGSRAARYLVGFGAGKAAGAVVCEVYEPGKSVPSLRIYARDTASFGAFGGDSVAYLNHIFNQISIRLSSFLEARIGG